MKVTVLLGGPSAEREVSLVSGAAVAKALREMGHDVFESDISPTNLAGLDHPADVIFPVLHGEFGESGELQEILEARGLPFVGSGSKASRLGMNKVTTKKAWEAAGLPTPPYFTLRKGDKIPGIPGTCVVKAIGSGSSIDVYVCKAPAEAEAQATEAIGKVLAKHELCLVEKFITGPELTVGLLEEKPLAPIRIIPKVEFFDYEAKYKRNDTEHRFDTGLPPEVIEKCRSLAEKANAVVGAKDLARIDIMLDEADGFAPYLLEINTLPGFTPKSLLPEAAAHAGIAFGPLVDRLAARAAVRGARTA
ncbi:D-alanine--D-alanine ligase family protein [Humisphaera borealis]|uniref:D-alanine--D-alanine ligase n=1 Tax=Humisphaera borealis TaxID=2807512 RepID=A0A7M2WU48_9BACT|nr:D-alanine--D-alanine ligase [Humisphaera borealis]QOV89006.1 D-alanine--D-alanine ligase [Humisphaera borealis]